LFCVWWWPQEAPKPKESPLLGPEVAKFVFSFFRKIEGRWACDGLYNASAGYKATHPYEKIRKSVSIF
jgi:hypothetical protein